MSGRVPERVVDGGERPDVILTVGFEAIPIGRGDAGRVVGRLDLVAPPDVDLGDSRAVETRGVGSQPSALATRSSSFVTPLPFSKYRFHSEV